MLALTILATALAADAGRTPERLPEDPALGAAATAEWRAHLAHEERERKLRYDRDRLKDHRAVLRFLKTTRARYERASTPAAVAGIRARLPPAVAAVRARIIRIDRWGVSSNLLGDYDVMLTALADAYPAARIRFLQGDRAPLEALRADFDRREKVIKAWLAEAAEAEDE